MTGRAVFTKSLSGRELAEVAAFAAGKNLIYKLDADTLRTDCRERSAHILYRAGDALTGYAALNYFVPGEAEVTFISEEEAAFELMYGELRRAFSGNLKKLIAIVNRADTRLAGWLGRGGFSFSNTELRMRFEASNYAPGSRNGLEVKNAGEEYAAAVLALDKAAFGLESAGEISPRDLSDTKIAFAGDKIVGKMRIESHEGVFAIYGFSISPEYRGKGFGRDFLSAVLEGITSQSYNKIYLEVEESNMVAFNLYKNSGFQVEAVFDYYHKRIDL
ncbi:MAG: GNAT family N-acetyltransferase [Oscillospiraceae bacterium]|jgi:ribosomal protein S18 acetylase RimI-like enzyme|nr:GNAT family N-acetyltransferase [Oscillospiraceae bacterium]